MNGYFENNKYENFATKNKPAATTTIPAIRGQILVQTPVQTPVQNPGQISGQKPGQISGQKPVQNPGQISGQNQISGQISGQNQKPGQNQKLGQKQKLGKNQKPGQKQKLGQKSVQKSVQKPGQKPVQKPVQKLGQKLGQISGQMQTPIEQKKFTTPIIKTSQNRMINTFKDSKIPGNKKASSLIFLIFVAIMVAVVFGIYYFKYSESYVINVINTLNGETITSSNISGMFMNVAFLAIILGSIVLCFVVFKAVVLKDDVNKNDALKILASVATIGLPVLAITLTTIGNMPLMLRSFENTFGYWFIKGKSLSDTTEKLFSNQNYNDYSIIVTQLFEENYKYYLTCMNRDYKADPDAINLNRFKNVFLDDKYFEDDKLKLDATDKENELFKLLKMVIRKRHVSEATWISLATVFTMYASYLYI